MTNEDTELPGRSGSALERPVRALEPEREAFEKWLADVHLLTATWNEQRNCYDEFPAHLAFKSWLAARAWIPMRERKPKGGQLIVKRWRNGAVWAGTHDEGPKNESFDEWKAL